MHRLTIVTTRISPLKTVAHKIRGVSYDRAIAPVTTSESRTLASVSKSILVGLYRQAISRHTLSPNPYTMREEWAEELGYLRLRRSWSLPDGDRCVVEIEAELLAAPVVRESRPVKERVIGHIAHRDPTKSPPPHRLTRYPNGSLDCACGERFRTGRIPMSHVKLIEAFGGMPTYAARDLLPSR